MLDLEDEPVVVDFVAPSVVTGTVEEFVWTPVVIAGVSAATRQYKTVMKVYTSNNRKL